MQQMNAFTQQDANEKGGELMTNEKKIHLKVAKARAVVFAEDSN